MFLRIGPDGRPSYFFPLGTFLRGFASGSSGDRVKPGDLDVAPLRLGPLSAASFASRNAFRRIAFGLTLGVIFGNRLGAFGCAL